ncbi:hypothetical protein [Sphaerochaeta sp. S2]|uniref:hypothetical protein n=1 Tax=Sphaerochaeta sp. S2 TaxID=2798868 RepID=UPI0018EA1FAE|nr:hypothetical protein [Sphaerochaeta sp. S2]MBJ2357026.1 hypothetical protein [Sphaerochaeta sp. S2]MDC7230407.1 hypothetical protein [Sphaerochaetaceae bacterium]
MKQGRLTPSIIVLILSLFVGFSLLAIAYKPSVILVVMLALVLMVLSVLLIRYAMIFDRQMREKQERQHEKETAR